MFCFDFRFRHVPRTLHVGPVSGTRRDILAGRSVRMRALVTALPQRDGKVLPAGRRRAVFPRTPVPGAGRRRQSGVHVQRGLHQVVRRRRVLQAVHAGPVRRGQHVQREHDGHRHGGRVRGRAVRRGQAVLSGRQGLSPGGHAGPVPDRSNRAVPGHGEDVHRGRVVPGHVRLRQHGAAGLRAVRRGRRVLLADAVRRRGPGRAHVQTAAAGLGQKTAAGQRRRRPGQQAATGPVRPPARHRRVDRPHVQAAVHAGTVRARRMGGAGPRQGHAPGQGLEDGQVRVSTGVRGRAGGRRREQRYRGVPAPGRHAGQVFEHERRVRQQGRWYQQAATTARHRRRRSRQDKRRRQQQQQQQRSADPLNSNVKTIYIHIHIYNFTCPRCFGIPT